MQEQIAALRVIVFLLALLEPSLYMFLSYCFLWQEQNAAFCGTNCRLGIYVFNRFANCIVQFKVKVT